MPSHPIAAAGCDPQPAAQSQTVSGATKRQAVAAVRLSSQMLFAGANEVEIEHKGALYRLRQTSLGKLILTK